MTIKLVVKKQRSMQSLFPIRKYQEIKEIDSYEPINILSQQLANFDKQCKEIEIRITMAELQNSVASKLNRKLHY